MTDKKHPLQHTESRRWIAAGTGGTPICTVELPPLRVAAEVAPAAAAPRGAGQVAATPRPSTQDIGSVQALPTSMAPLLEPDEGVDDPETADTVPSATRLFRPEARKTWGLDR